MFCHSLHCVSFADGLKGEHPLNLNVCPHKNPVANIFPDGDGGHAVDHAHFEEAHSDGDDASQKRHPRQQSRPGTVAAHPFLSFLQLFRRCFRQSRNPLLASQRTDAVVEERAQCVSCRAPKEQVVRVAACCQHAQHDDFAAKRKETACQKGSHKHSDVAVTNEDLNELFQGGMNLAF